MRFDHLYQHLPPREATRMAALAESLQKNLERQPRLLPTEEPKDPTLRPKTANVPPPMPEGTLENFRSYGIGSKAQLWRDHIPSKYTPEPVVARGNPRLKRYEHSLSEEQREAQALRPHAAWRSYVSYIHQDGHWGRKGKRNNGRKPFDRFTRESIQLT